MVITYRYYMGDVLVAHVMFPAGAWVEHGQLPEYDRVEVTDTEGRHEVFYV